MTFSVQLAGLVGTGFTLFLLKSRWNYLRLPKIPVETRKTGDVTVIIPARNEAANIRRVAESFPSVRVIVVDDASDDGTAKVAASAGARVLPAPPLPPGMTGKPNACQAGADAANTDWLLFVDADTWYKPEFVPSLLHYAERESLDMVSCFLRQETRSFFEMMLLPYAFALYFCGVNAAAVNRIGSGEALANGQCLLFSREAYQKIGGHRAVADSIIEDVALAAEAKRVGLRTRVTRAEHLGSVRMYDSLLAIWRGFQKNSFRFLLVNPWSGIQVVLASVLLTSYFPVILFLLTQDEYVGLAVFVLLPFVLLMPWYRNPFKAILLPGAIYLFQLIALGSMVSTIFGLKTSWKGRAVG